MSVLPPGPARQGRVYSMADPMSKTSRKVYSLQRFRLVVALLTLIFLPIVIGASVLIYHYVRFSVLVEQRLQGERWQIPSRVYARPVILRPGLVLDADWLGRILNGLRYTQRTAEPAAPGEFALVEGGVIFWPRPVPGGADEPLLIVFGDEVVTEIRGAGQRRYDSQALEPELITYLFDESREKRRRIRYEELPEHLVQAVLAIEDRRFFSHPGLDPFRFVGAVVRNLRSDSAIPHGASTITQQLCKNFFLTPERTLKRKAQEALLAFVLERRASKQEILELYLNEVYLGQGGSFSLNGVGQAASRYFRKDVGNLTLPESAMLAGMIQSPEPLQPLPPPRARHRPAQHRDPLHARRRVHRRGDDGGSPGHAADGRVRERGPHRRPLLRGPRSPAAGEALRSERPHDPEPLDLHHPRPAPPDHRPAGPRARPRRRPGDHQEADHQDRPGLAHRHRAAQRQGRGPRRGALLREEPVQPGDAGPAPARQHLQALRLPRRPSRRPSTIPRCRRSPPPPSSRTRPRSSSTRTRSTSRRTTRTSTSAS